LKSKTLNPESFGLTFFWNSESFTHISSPYCVSQTTVNADFSLFKNSISPKICPIPYQQMSLLTDILT